MHWFNPPEWTPGVEVIPSAHTDPQRSSSVHVNSCWRLASGRRRSAAAPDLSPTAFNLRSSARHWLVSKLDWRHRKRLMKWCAAALDSACRSMVRFRSLIWRDWMSTPVSLPNCGRAWTLAGIRRRLLQGYRWMQVSHGTKNSGGILLIYSEEERDELLIERDKRYAALKRSTGLSEFRRQSTQDSQRHKR